MFHKAITFFLTLTAAAALLLCPGCGERTAVFEADGLSISLTSDYREEEQENMTAYYESSMAAVMIQKYSFAEVSGAGLSTDISTVDYAELIIQSGGLDSVVTEEDGVAYFEYVSEVDSVSFSYLACVYKGGDAFWLVQFSSISDIYDEMKSEFLTFAESVVI